MDDGALDVAACLGAGVGVFDGREEGVSGREEDVPADGSFGPGCEAFCSREGPLGPGVPLALLDAGESSRWKSGNVFFGLSACTT